LNDELYSLLAALAVATLGFGWVVWMAKRSRMSASSTRTPTESRSLDRKCPTCQALMMFSGKDLTPLSREEMALTVRVRPDLVGRKLWDYVCPGCNAAHVFAASRRGYEWIGANMYLPHATSHRCAECRTILARSAPPHDGRLDRPSSIKGLPPDTGLACSRCNAAVCFACCEQATRNRTQDGSLLCPRCFRGPMVYADSDGA